MEIGFIGLGLMGRPMAINVARGGHTLHIWARRSASLEPFAQFGAHAHVSPAEVAKHADLVVTMVADAPDVEEVTLGENGVAAGGKKGQLVVDMSTINIQQSALWRAFKLVLGSDTDFVAGMNLVISFIREPS